MVMPLVVGGMLLAVVFLSMFALTSYGFSFKAEKKMSTAIANEELMLDAEKKDFNLVAYFVIKEEVIVVEKTQERYEKAFVSVRENVIGNSVKEFIVDGIYCQGRSGDATMNGESVTVVVVYDFTNEYQLLYILSQIVMLTYFAALLLLALCTYIMSSNAIRPIKEAYFVHRQLISDVSHELKTPITVVSANLELMSSDKNATIESNSKWIENSQNQIKRMNNLIMQMLELASIEEGKFVPQYQKIDISEIAEGVILSFEASCFEKSITVSTDIQENMSAKGKSREFEKLMNILLDNAIKYTNEKGSINFTLRKESMQHIKLRITNTGDGIDYEDLPYIFDRFYRAKGITNERTDSFGLGLSIAKSIAQNMKGDISCVSEKGKSTTFEVTLPYEYERGQKREKGIK